MINILDRLLKGFLVLLICSMLATVCWQVISRYVLQAPSSLTEEIARFHLIWLGIGGAVYTFRTRMHVSIDTMVANLTGRKRLIAEILSLAATQVFAALVLVYGGIKLVLLTFTLNQTSAALGLPMAYVYAIIPISGILIIIYAGYFMRQAMTNPSSLETPTPNLDVS